MYILPENIGDTWYIIYEYKYISYNINCIIKLYIWNFI